MGSLKNEVRLLTALDGQVQVSNLGHSTKKIFSKMIQKGLDAAEKKKEK